MESLPSTSEEPREGDAQIDLTPVLDDIRDLRDSLASYQGLEHSMVELAQTTEFNHSELNEQLTELREAIEALTEIAQNTAPVSGQDRRFGDTTDRGGRWGSAMLGIQWNPTTKMVIAVFAGVLLTGWSIRAYVKTGNPYIAILGLLVANIVGAIAILTRRQPSVC